MAGVEEEINTEERNIENNESTNTPTEVADAADGEEEKGTGLKLPLARIKRIMKTDPDFNLASSDAVFLISKATELFLESLAQEVYHYTCQARRKTVSRRDLDNSIEAIEALAFLDGAID